MPRKWISWRIVLYCCDPGCGQRPHTDLEGRHNPALEGKRYWGMQLPQELRYRGWDRLWSRIHGPWDRSLGAETHWRSTVETLTACYPLSTITPTVLPEACWEVTECLNPSQEPVTLRVTFLELCSCSLGRKSGKGLCKTLLQMLLRTYLCLSELWPGCWNPWIWVSCFASDTRETLTNKHLLQAWPCPNLIHVN